MADKTYAAIGTGAKTEAITTAGTIDANAITVVFDDATPMSDIMELLERAKVKIQTYYSEMT